MLSQSAVRSLDGKSCLVLQPILMTSFAFILGCLPLMLATGSGAAAHSTMGTGVVFGMTIATAIGVFLIPVCYVFIQRMFDRGGKNGPEPVTAASPQNLVQRNR
jgi:hydrophobic/amphiphilic exporter-1 (mainly G- bacteria), HAE1 family